MRRPLLLALLPAVLVASGCSSAAPAAPATASSCPRTAGDGVPASTTDTGGRLVPAEAPAAVRVCRYQQSGGSPASSELAGQRDLTGGLDRPAADLQLAVGPTAGTVLCAGYEPAPTPYLLRLSYPEGAVWLRSDVDGCTGTRSSASASRTSVADVLAASFASGTWTVPPLPGVGRRCVPDRTGRAAGAGSLLPEGATSLVLCRVAGDGVTRHRASASDTAAVQDVLSDPVAVPFSEPCSTGSAPYELAATYPTGPAVLLRYAPGCDPEVENGSLAAQLEAPGRRRLDALLAAAF